MAKNSVADWDENPNNNTDIGGINIAEGCAPSGINNAIRTMMSQSKAGFMSTADKARLDALWPLASGTSTADVDTYVTPGWVPTLVRGTQPNGWGDSTYRHLLVLVQSSNIAQFGVPRDAAGSLIWRTRQSGTWSPWREASVTGHTHEAADIISGVLAIARIPGLDADKIVSGTLGGNRIPDLHANKITAGTLDDARIPNLAASKVNSGTFADARIPSLNASKITAGVLPPERGGTGQTTEAAMRGVYTGSLANNLDYPVSTELLVRPHTGADPLRNEAATVGYDNTLSTSSYYLRFGAGLSGTWRCRGALAADVSPTAALVGFKMQRTA